jgi:hypothetical protein
LTFCRKRYLWKWNKSLMIFPSPSTLYYSRYTKRINAKYFSLTKPINSCYWRPFWNICSIVGYMIDQKFLHLLDNKFLLLCYNLAYSRVINIRVNFALHHSSSFVVFYISSPSLNRYFTICRKSLLSKIPKG